MSTVATMQQTFQELDHRADNGIAVWLLWNRETNGLSVVAVDDKTDETLVLDVAADEALDVFNHPYAYASFRGLLAAEPDQALAA